MESFNAFGAGCKRRVSSEFRYMSVAVVIGFGIKRMTAIVETNKKRIEKCCSAVRLNGILWVHHNCSPV